MRHSRFTEIIYRVLLSATLLVAGSSMPGCGTAADNGGSGTGTRKTAPAPVAQEIKVGHLVGVCMSPLFLADAKGYFRDEGLDVKLVWMPNPGDATSTLAAGSIDFIHNPFTNTFVADGNGADLRIIAGSGNGGLVCIAQGDSGIKTVADLKARAGKGLRVGSERINTLELTFFRLLQNHGMDYKDFEMVWFTDHFAMLSAFESRKVDVVTHVEPYATQLIKKSGGVPLATSFEEWGPGAPDCVVSARADTLKNRPEVVKKYLRALLRADGFIKSNMAEAVDYLDKGKYYKVDKATLADALPRQPPGVDLRSGVKEMNLAIDDMITLGYLKSKPTNVVDLGLLEQVASSAAQPR